MNPGGDAAEQVVRLSLEGMEVTARIAGTGAKNIALLLYATLKQEQKTKGRARLTGMLKSGKELKVYTITQKDLHRGKLVNKSDIEILTAYNAEVMGMYNFYSIANNVYKIGRFANLMKYSMYKTYACKYKTNVHEIKRRYCVNGLFMVEYETRQGRKSTTFYRDGYKRKEVATKFDNVSELPQFSKYAKTNTLKQRVERNCCELCGKRTKELEIHQVKKLKDLKGTADWVLTMRRMRRKTLVVCTECHQRIHSCNATMIGGEPYTSRGVRTVREGVDARPH